MSVRIAFTEELWREVEHAVALDVESAAVLLAGSADSEHGHTLLARRLIWVPEDAYEVRERRRLAIRSGGYVPALGQAAAEGAHAIFLHTHPGAPAVPSEPDERVDAELRGPFELRTCRAYASVIVGGTPDEPRFSGHEQGEPFEALRVVGGRLRLLSPEGSTTTAAGQAFDRHARAFGPDGQRLLAALRVGVVGAGGTGSAVCEQLARLGVGEILLIDDDNVTDTNLTRIHESARADVGRPKVEVAADAVKRIGLGTTVHVAVGRITELELAMRLRHCDVVFGCTDDNRGRAILSRVAYWYLLTVIDCAFVVDTAGEHIRGLFGRVSSVYPGAACMLCRENIDQALIAAESLEPAERARLAGEGYVPGLGAPDPSVGTYTTLIASFAVNELLARLFGYGGEHPPSEMLLRLHDRYISNRSPAPRAGHYCADRQIWGRGDEQPFLDQLWP
jgi:proteasome lid subunit RPN8/RPN11